MELEEEYMDFDEGAHQFNHPCVETQTFSQRLKLILRELKYEVQSSLIRLIHFFVQNILLIWISLTECIWMIILNLVAYPLKWNLSFLRFLLKNIVKGLNYLSFFAFVGFGWIMRFFKQGLDLIFDQEEEEQ